MIDASLVLNALDHANTRLKFMILDACRNNPFATRGLLRQGGNLAAAVSRGLAVISPPNAAVIWYATQPGNVASDGAGKNSPFALAISHNVTIPGRDVFAVFNQTGLEVMRLTNNKQQPWLASSPVPRFLFSARIEGSW